jgi:histidinol-phosphatase
VVDPIDVADRSERRDRPSPQQLRTELAFALRLADLADAETLPRYLAKTFSVEHKRDRSEVTEADRNAEAAISEGVLAERPGHGLFGEEHGLIGPADSPWQWIIDPIDGTSNFVRGIPVWATLIGLTYLGQVVVGVVSAPALGRRWWAGRGHGAFVDGQPIRVSDIASLADAQVCVTLCSGWDQLGLTSTLVEYQSKAWRTRGFGDFWQHMLVAEGAVEVAVDAVGLQPYDLAAVKIIVEEAGGTFTDRFGVPTYLSDTAISTNGIVPGPF